MEDDSRRRITLHAKEEGEGETTKQHINVDNVSYVKIVDSDITVTGMIVMLGIPAMIGLFALFQVGMWEALISTALVFLFTLYLFSLPGGVEVGTTTEPLTVEDEDAEEVEEKFERRVQEDITLKSESRILLEKTKYRYHFVPDNIVSVKHEGGITVNGFVLLGFVIAFLASLSGAAGGVITGIIVAFVGYWIPQASQKIQPSRPSFGTRSHSHQTDRNILPGWIKKKISDLDERSGILVRRKEEGPEEVNVLLILGGLVCLHALFTLSLLELLIGAALSIVSFAVPGIAVSDGVDIKTKGGHETSFYMSADDAQTFLSEFESRP